MPNSKREAVRQHAVAELQLLDTPPEPEFDALARLAQRMLSTSMSSVTLFDAERQWFKARCGPLASETARSPALCAAVFESEQAILVADASLDERFAHSEFVTGEPHIRFYAGVPMRATQANGDMVTIGTLCALDGEPRTPKASDLETLQDLGSLANALVDARAAALRAAQMSEKRRFMVESLERERRQFKQAEQMAGIGSWRHDLAGNVTTWSDGVFAIHELPVSAGVPMGEVMNYFPEPYRTAFREAVLRTLGTGEPFEMEADFNTAKNNRRRVRCSCEIELSQGEAVALIGLIQDITEQYDMAEKLLRHARTDDLTQLANRREFDRVLDQRIRAAEQAGSDLAVLLIDLDRFKAVNDNLGHGAGDEVLRRVAERLISACGSAYFPARIGGDEFAVIAPIGVTNDQLVAVANSIIRDLRISVTGAGATYDITGSAGYAWLHAAGNRRDSLLRQADEALYNAKKYHNGEICGHG